MHVLVSTRKSVDYPLIFFQNLQENKTQIVRIISGPTCTYQSTPVQSGPVQLVQANPILLVPVGHGIPRKALSQETHVCLVINVNHQMPFSKTPWLLQPSIIRQGHRKRKNKNKIINRTEHPPPDMSWRLQSNLILSYKDNWRTLLFRENSLTLVNVSEKTFV